MQRKHGKQIDELRGFFKNVYKNMYKTDLVHVSMHPWASIQNHLKMCD